MFLLPLLLLTVRVQYVVLSKTIHELSKVSPFLVLLLNDAVTEVLSAIFYTFLLRTVLVPTAPKFTI